MSGAFFYPCVNTLNITKSLTELADFNIIFFVLIFAEYIKIFHIFALLKKKIMVYYRWRESFNNVWHNTRCEVLEHNNKTVKIKLLEFGKNQRPVGSVMRVHLKSLVGFPSVKPSPDLEWQKYTYFE